MRWLALLGLLASAGCATVFHSRTTEVWVETNPPGIPVLVDGVEVGPSPLYVDVPNQGTHTISLKLAGERRTGCTFTSSVRIGWVILDIVTGIWPLLVDGLTGAWTTLDDDVCILKVTQ